MTIRMNIVQCRVKRKFVRGKDKYYLQPVFKGVPPMKVNKSGEIKREISKGIVELDIGTQTIVIVCRFECKID